MAPRDEDLRCDGRRRTSFLILTGQGDPERLRGDRATAELLPMLGASPLVGRYFLPSEDKPGADAVAVLSEGLLRRRFAGDPSAVVRSVTLSGRPYTIIGVAPHAVTAVVGDSQLWVPMAFDEKEAALYGAHYLRAFGRLKAGTTPREAATDLERVALQLEAAFPGSNGGWRVLVSPMHEYLVRNVRAALITLSAGRGARAADRLRERRLADARTRHGAAARTGGPGGDRRRHPARSRCARACLAPGPATSACIRKCCSSPRASPSSRRWFSASSRRSRSRAPIFASR
jgi:hypothetical protein